MLYRSKASLLGLPLIHVSTAEMVDGRVRRGVARGWIAVGDIAFGVVSIGAIAFGGITLGGLGLGLISLAGLSLGGYAIERQRTPHVSTAGMSLRRCRTSNGRLIRGRSVQPDESGGDKIS